jgi:2-methylcitrate dehydratase PrpD
MPSPSASQTITRRFAECMMGVRFETLPQQAIEIAKQVTLDGLAVMLAGVTEPLGIGRIVTEHVRDLGGHPHATVIGGGFKTSITEAAFANGTMAHALDFDNTFYPLNHPTSPTLPAILALAEQRGCSGAEVIEAIVTAFEVQARLRMAATGMHTGRGFHKPGMTGTFGATAGAAKLLHLDIEQLLMALGIAGSRAGSMSINTGTMTKSSHSGHAARSGLESSLLAARGWTASADVFGPGGFFDTFLSGEAEPELLIEGFGKPFRMVDPGVGFKKYPSNYFTHRPIDAALVLRRQYAISSAEIDSVEVLFPRFDYVNRPKPATGLDGKFSVQYTTAVALLDGEITVDSFDNSRRFAADIEALLPRVTLTFDDSIPVDFKDMHVVVTVRLRDGRCLTRRMKELSGFVGFPLSREQRVTKFMACARRIIDMASAEKVLSLVENLEQLSGISEIMDMVRG